jgi:iron complex outermembrane receptor protein
MANDPCDRRFVNNGPDPANRRANCIADLGPGYDPATFDSAIVAAIRSGRTGGNPDLLNETAESYSIGLTFQPTFWENFVFTADYINIELQDAISSLTLTALMDACYDAPGGDAAPCTQFTRDAAGQVVDFQSGQTNASLSTVEVMNYMATYNLEMNSWGSLLSRLRLSNTLERELSVIGGVPTSDLGEFVDPEWSGSLDLNWELANSLRFAYRLLWQPPSKFDSTGAIVFQYPTPADPTDNSSNIVSKSDTWWMSNLAVSYDFAPMLGRGHVETLVGQLSINNLFDHQPDTLQQAWLHYGLDEILGRQISVSIQGGF